MSTYWLRRKIEDETNAKTDRKDPVITINYSGGSLSVYCPNPSEYAVDSDVVKKAADLGAEIIAYASTWCKATYEAKQYGKSIGVDVMPYAGLFALLKRRGVLFIE
ncbi:MAG: hypothetical protein Q8R81_12400 [Novosphingobium sp.]|uniref:hypothetical protein n=1 Tax=Novosphingobium sp. TaxID=1874826 RepID=UPI002735E109|nr:hypothetical protein [Novosphingobium sp.]MDP3551178.1 hypothetical protein [Novosphingobium sp.]